MSGKKLAVTAHRGESDGARACEDVPSPFDAGRLLLLPLCAERLAPERIIPQLRLSASGSKLRAMTVPVLEEKLAPGCRPGWTGDHPCARRVMERWSEVLGSGPACRGQVRLERLEFDEEVEDGPAAAEAPLRLPGALRRRHNRVGVPRSADSGPHQSGCQAQNTS